MILEQIPDIQRLTSSEKLVLVSELWDDLAAHPDNIPVSRAILDELDKRLDDYHKNPDQVTSWEDIKTRILGSK